ncbi:hypothetical protein ABE10_00415 [Bacillus toyonensis]|nr:hypothetical protein [Bacillus toyonensis]
MSQSGQEDVAARLVRLRLDRETDVVPAVGDVGGEQVHRLAVALQGEAHVLRRVILRPLAPAPHDERPGPELGGEVEVAQRLSQCEPSDRAVVRREPAVLEHGGGEQVGRHHRDAQSGTGERALETVDLLPALGIGGAEGEEVVVVEGQTVRAELGQPLDDVDHIERGTGRTAERIGAGVADGPEPEGELVVEGGDERHEGILAL